MYLHDGNPVKLIADHEYKSPGKGWVLVEFQNGESYWVVESVLQHG